MRGKLALEHDKLEREQGKRVGVLPWLWELLVPLVGSSSGLLAVAGPCLYRKVLGDRKMAEEHGLRNQRTVEGERRNQRTVAGEHRIQRTVEGEPHIQRTALEVEPHIRQTMGRRIQLSALEQLLRNLHHRIGACDAWSQPFPCPRENPDCHIEPSLQRRIRAAGPRPTALLLVEIEYLKKSKGGQYKCFLSSQVIRLDQS